MNDDLSNNGVKKYLSEKVVRSAIFIIVNLAFVIVASIFVGYEPVHLAIKRNTLTLVGLAAVGVISLDIRFLYHFQTTA